MPPHGPANPLPFALLAGAVGWSPAAPNHLQGGQPEWAQCLQLRESYQTDWTNPEDLTLDLTALDLDGLYESIVRQIAGDAIAAPQAESLKEAVEQTQAREKLEKQIAALRVKMKKEKNLGRQMEIRREMMKLEKDYEGT